MLDIFLGRCNDPNFWNQNIYWKPQKEQNPHLLISGMSGSGKTETLKVICHELRNQGVPLLIFDFHNDFTAFGDNLINEKNIKIHPLQVLIGQKPKDVVYQVSSILKHTFDSLTPVQEGTIRSAIKKFYKDSGIYDLSELNDGSIQLLPFLEFKECLRDVTADQRTRTSIDVKLDILFDYEVFSAQKDAINFDSLMNKSTIFQLKNAPSDDVKQIVAELMINKLINYSYHQDQTKKIRLYCILDEAHRMVYAGSPIDKLMREARKYGIGVILASQRATDFNEVLLANSGAILTLKQNLAKDAKYIAKNKWGDPERLMNAKQGEGYIRFSSEKRAIEVQIVPLYDRKLKGLG